MAQSILSVKNLVKRFPARSRTGTAVVAADNVSFTMYAGQVVALIGESGSGKTSIARILTGIERPTSGQVSWGDEQHSASPNVLRQRVQMVFQDPFSALNPMNPISYTLSRPLINYRKLSPRTAYARVLDLLEEVQLSPATGYIAKRPFELSGGQRQRVVIARALAADPKVIVADEPVSMLDVSIRAEILQLLKSVMTDKGVQTMLYITHDLLSARLIAEQVLVLYKGRIVESGRTHDILAHPHHPYTQLLLSSIPNPRIKRIRSVRKAPSPGRVTSSGCAFAPRCPLAMEHCWTQIPPVMSFQNGSSVACFAVNEQQSAG